MFPTIEYGGIVLSNMSCMLLKKLQTYQNACIRYIFGLKKHDHVSELRSSVMWLPVGRRLEHQTLCLLWKTMNEELSPSYLQSSFHPLQQSQHNTRSQHLLQIPLHRTDFMSKSFAVNAARLWNQLPVKLRILENRNSFKCQTKEYMLSLGE
uniref:Uncharacterized protein n=1 Tax=Cacopsylla melanoneura TaxID=428564 RepID=A0A8D8SXU3_9HEMI